MYNAALNIYNNWKEARNETVAPPKVSGGGHMPQGLPKDNIHKNVYHDYIYNNRYPSVYPPTVSQDTPRTGLVPTIKHYATCPECNQTIYCKPIACFGQHCSYEICNTCYEKRRLESQVVSMEHVFYCIKHDGKDNTYVKPYEFTGKKKKKVITVASNNSYTAHDIDAGYNAAAPKAPKPIELNKICVWCNHQISFIPGDPASFPRKCLVASCRDLICGDCRAPDAKGEVTLECYKHST
jgi:hypothetical protein